MSCPKQHVDTVIFKKKCFKYTVILIKYFVLKQNCCSSKSKYCSKYKYLGVCSCVRNYEFFFYYLAQYLLRFWIFFKSALPTRSIFERQVFFFKSQHVKNIWNQYDRLIFSKKKSFNETNRKNVCIIDINFVLNKTSYSNLYFTIFKSFRYSWTFSILL